MFFSTPSKWLKTHINESIGSVVVRTAEHPGILRNRRFFTLTATCEETRTDLGFSTGVDARLSCPRTPLSSDTFSVISDETEAARCGTNSRDWLPSFPPPVVPAVS